MTKRKLLPNILKLDVAMTLVIGLVVGVAPPEEKEFVIITIF